MDVSKNSGFSPNHPLKNRVFHYNHPFWCTTVFGNTHFKCYVSFREIFFWEMKSHRDYIHYLMCYSLKLSQSLAVSEPYPPANWHGHETCSWWIFQGDVTGSLNGSTGFDPKITGLLPFTITPLLGKFLHLVNLGKHAGKTVYSAHLLVSVFASINNCPLMSRFEYPQEYSEEECGLTHGPPVFEMQTQNMAWVSLVVKNMFNSCPKKIQGDRFFLPLCLDVPGSY